MPRYFFDTIDAGVASRDEVGIDLPDDEAARRHVGKILPHLAQCGLPDGDAHAFECTVRDEDGNAVYRANLNYQGTMVSPEDEHPAS